MTSKMLVASSAAAMQGVCKGTADSSIHDKVGVRARASARARVYAEVRLTLVFMARYDG